MFTKQRRRLGSVQAKKKSFVLKSYYYRTETFNKDVLSNKGNMNPSLLLTLRATLSQNEQDKAVIT